ncbi:amidase [Nitriliruptor alkaliphilus]|uniref:amidase n=1 Tax=Nitriliruptor alkaliphilus TaxID=427918 RepID=UPI0006960883|nr:amidase [Nitriliruptor alkaliphilus]
MSGVTAADGQLVGRPAVELAAAVRSGTVRAVDVVRAHLDQIASVEHRLGAYVTVMQREAMAAAEAVDAHPNRASLPLAGVPVAIKDVAAVAGQPTRHGSLATSPAPAEADEEVVARWRAAGAVIVGITRCCELSLWGTSDDPSGTAVSPWQPTRTAGGSSGGSGAAVAAGTVALSLATDGLGSARIPPGCCGLVGIKPGRGLALERMPDGRPFWFGMSRYGPIATCVADTALGLATMTGRPELADVTPPERPLTVAVSWAPPAPGILVSRPWIDAAAEAARLLRHAGHRIVHADPPYELATVVAALLRWTQTVSEDVRQLVVDPDALQERTRRHGALGDRLARRFPVSDAQAERWHTRVEPLLTDHDVLITPMFAKAPLRARAWHRDGWLANVVANLTTYPFAAAWNLADVPAATVPMGSHGGQPLAVQIIGRRGSEATVLSVAAELERLAPWPRHAPAWGVPAA